MSPAVLRYRRSPAALSRTVGNEVLACLPDWDEIDRLSASGGAIWRRLSEPRTLSELCAEVSAEFAVRPADVREDVRKFVALLVKRGLVQRVPRGGGTERAANIERRFRWIPARPPA